MRRIDAPRAWHDTSCEKVYMPDDSPIPLPNGRVRVMTERDYKLIMAVVRHADELRKSTGLLDHTFLAEAIDDLNERRNTI